MINIHQTVTNCVIYNFLKQKASFQYPFEPVKQNNRQETQKLPSKIKKINEKPPN